MRAQVIYNQELENQKQQIINVSLLAGNKIGPQGLKGDSAYKIAVQNGFEGTEEEWLASLVGEKGDTGRTPEITANKSGTTTTIYADGIAIGAIEDGHDAPGTDDLRASVDKLVSRMHYNRLIVINTMRDLGDKVDAFSQGMLILDSSISPSGKKAYCAYISYGDGEYGFYWAIEITDMATGKRYITWSKTYFDWEPWKEIAVINPGESLLQIDDTQASAINPWSGQKINAELVKKIDDVIINGSSIVNNNVAEIPIADAIHVGLVKASSTDGIAVNTDGYIKISNASASLIKTGTDTKKPIVPYTQHQATFYGLAKAAGDTTQSQSNKAVGTYTDEAKTAIKTMLGVPALIVQDVQIDGTSIAQNGIVDIPFAEAHQAGLVRVTSSDGISQKGNGYIQISLASADEIKTGINLKKPIVPFCQHTSTFYGLAKAAGDTTQSQSNNAVGTYTEEAKSAIQSMLGIDTAISDAIGDITGFDFEIVNTLPVSGEKGIIYLVANSHGDNDAYDEYIWVTNGFEKIGNTSVDLSNYVTFDDYATNNRAGVVKVATTYGIRMENGVLRIDEAASSIIKQGTDPDHPIVSKNQHEATFYGLAKSAGDTTQSQSSNAVGQYTDEAKSAIKTMLGVTESPVQDVQINNTTILDANGVAKIPIASGTDFGVVKINNSNGITIDNSGKLRIEPAAVSTMKTATGNDSLYKAVVPNRQHASVFYGLAKAAGDTTQSQSSNAVGIYTDEAKLSIQSMLGVPTSDIIAPQFDTSLNYSAGDYVINEGKLYKFTASHATGALDGSDTTEVTIGEEFINSTTAITNAQIDALFA